MQFIIHTEKDFKKIVGKFILQVDSRKPDTELCEENWFFMSCKRLFIIGSNYQRIDLVDGHVSEREDWDFEKFKKWFNNYTFDHTKEGEENLRFHRLLTHKELDFLVMKMKQKNY